MSETSIGSGEHPKVVDLMDALERSVAEAKEARKRKTGPTDPDVEALADEAERGYDDIRPREEVT